MKRLLRDRQGSATAEFVLTIPIAIVIIFGAVQLGVAFWANAGLQNGIGEAARTATLWPPRDDTAIKAEMTRATFGIKADQMPTPTLVRGVDGSQKFVDISVNYSTKINFFLFEVPGVTLSHRRRAYIP